METRGSRATMPRRRHSWSVTRHIYLEIAIRHNLRGSSIPTFHQQKRYHEKRQSKNDDELCLYGACRTISSANQLASKSGPPDLGNSECHRPPSRRLCSQARFRVKTVATIRPNHSEVRLCAPAALSKELKHQVCVLCSFVVLGFRNLERNATYCLGRRCFVRRAL